MKYSQRKALTALSYKYEVGDRCPEMVTVIDTGSNPMPPTKTAGTVLMSWTPDSSGFELAIS